MDAVYYVVTIDFDRRREPEGCVGEMSVHGPDGWHDIGTAFTDGLDADNLQVVARDFPHGDALIKQARGQPGHVGIVAVDDIRYAQEHRTLSAFVWAPSEEGSSTRVLIHATFRLLE